MKKKSLIASNILIFFIIIYILSLITFVILKIDQIINTNGIYSISFKFILALIILFFILLFFIYLILISKNYKINLSIFFFITLFLFLLFEFFLEYSRDYSDYRLIEREKIAKKQNKNFDSRSTLEVINELKKTNSNVYPNVLPKFLINDKTFVSSNLLPLGSISYSTTIYDNENGEYPIIKLDKYGFNNIEDFYKEGFLEIALIGDSFTEGYSVKQNENILSFILDNNYKAISIAKAGNGPLLQYASYVEYVKNLKPRNIIWLYHTNDFNDLKHELNSNILLKYLEDRDYSQNLTNKQKEIDNLLKKYIKNKLNQEIVNNNKNLKNKIKFNNTFFRVIKFNNTRNIIANILSSKMDNPEIDKMYLEIYEKILLNVISDLRTWNGKLYFLYLPSQEEFKFKNEDFSKKYILEIINNLKIQYGDISKEFVLTNSDPLAYFPYRMPGHYNKEGYEIIAEKIISLIEN